MNQRCESVTRPLHKNIWIRPHPLVDALVGVPGNIMPLHPLKPKIENLVLQRAAILGFVEKENIEIRLKAFL